MIAKRYQRSKIILMITIKNTCWIPDFGLETTQMKLLNEIILQLLSLTWAKSWQDKFHRAKSCAQFEKMNEEAGFLIDVIFLQTFTSTIVFAFVAWFLELGGKVLNLVLKWRHPLLRLFIPWHATPEYKTLFQLHGVFYFVD